MGAKFARYADIGVTWPTNFWDDLWSNVSRYRKINLIIPSTVQAPALVDLCELLLATIERLLGCWARLKGTRISARTPEVTIQLGRLFVIAMGRTRLRRIHEAMEKLAKYIAENQHLAKWTVTAMTELRAQNTLGRSTLEKLRSAPGIEVVGLSKTQVPRNTEYCHAGYVQAVGRGTHVRFGE
ncbi:hypothetical protein GMOD_00005158 [Pyrenophora seminiperda CCB06]|uniref:Uncharacterized protein n=1 Tax=Pyrenophora seminiperda CCB06 TaxID=1302712 RepID=A0A3M7LV44_9PLEO|nr:hypothetical protein GMOD_00005158 [Pyrenophora seminiperda CCB06]